MSRRIPIVDLRQLLLALRDTPSDRAVSRETSLDRRTVQRYRRWAHQQQLLTDPLLPLEELQLRRHQTLPDPLPPQNLSSVEPFRETVVRLRKENVNIRALFARLKERGYTGSYGSVYRFVKILEPVVPDTCVRVETAPGEEAQVDFGAVGHLSDPDSGLPRRVYAFVMTLSWSRHQYVEFVFDQKIETWLLLHVHAFSFFGGSVERITCDNLKAAIVRAAWDDPVAHRSYAECAEHYGFRIAPCRPRTPQHKGKVERGIGYVQGNFWAGRELVTLQQANREARAWCLTEAGLRLHGTTHERPWERFERTERDRLRPLPATAYDRAVFKQVRLHRDNYVVFDRSFYSAPFRLIGQRLWARGGLTQVKLYDADHRCVATHERATQPGQRLTHPDHLPPHKRPGLEQTRESCREEAAAVGGATTEIVEALLSDPVLERLPTAGRLVRLASRYSAERLEAACERALRFGDPTYATVKGILQKGMEDREGAPDAPIRPISGDRGGSANFPALPPPSYTFARSMEELFSGFEEMFGGEELKWN